MLKQCIIGHIKRIISDPKLFSQDSLSDIPQTGRTKSKERIFNMCETKREGESMTVLQENEQIEVFFSW